MKLIAACLVLAVPVLAQAKGTYPPGPISDWFQQQHNSTGQWCCDQADGHLFYGNYKIKSDGGVHLTDDDGTAYDIDKSQVLTGPNPTGAAVWWFSQYKDGGPKYTYCFSPGAAG